MRVAKRVNAGQWACANRGKHEGSAKTSCDESGYVYGNYSKPRVGYFKLREEGMCRENRNLIKGCAIKQGQGVKGNME